MDRCLNCMQETTTDLCPYCGYNISAYEVQPGALKPQTCLKGRYYLGRVLGRGGFGITYNGWDAQTGRRVAIKEYFPTGLAIRMENHNTISALSSVNTHTYKSGVVKFYDEAQILSEFRDVKEIVEIYDFFYENETSYIVMEYVDGENICHIMAHQKRMDTDTAVDIILKLTDAIIKVHTQDVLHRDISPSNIIVTEDGGIKLIDFGSARQFALDQPNSMSVILKNGFAPIEQYSRKGNHGPWTDIYSICATFYYMITGKLPEQATDRLIEDALIPPSKLGADITPKQEVMLLKGLAVKVKDRYQTASELKSAIGKAFGNHPVTARPVPTEEQKTAALEDAPVPVPKEKKSLYVPIILTAILAMMIILTMLSLTIWRKPPENIQADADTTVEDKTESQTDEIEITVKQAEIESATVTLNKNTLTLKQGETAALTVTIAPSNTTDKNITWLSDNKNVARVTGGKVTAISAGTAAITAKTSNGKTANCTVTVTFTEINKEITASGTCGVNATWTLYRDGELVIDGNGKMENYNNYVNNNRAPWYNYINDIKTIKINTGISNIGILAFVDCINLLNITIPNSVITIGSSAFLNCVSLIKITIPNNVINIGSSAFENCASLINITIPNNVNIIGDNAFSYCSSLTNITISSSVSRIDKNVFTNCSSLTSINVDSDNTNYSNDEYGVLYNKNKTELIVYPAGNTRFNFTIPNSVTHLSDQGAFQNCVNLTNITIPNSVTDISYATFFGCTSLTNITIPNSVTIIDSYAFFNCINLTNITIPDSVSYISINAFAGCNNITNITIPNSVTYLGDRAFDGWTNKQTIYIEGRSNAPTDWASGWNTNCNAVIKWNQ